MDIGSVVVSVALAQAQEGGSVAPAPATQGPMVPGGAGTTGQPATPPPGPPNAPTGSGISFLLPVIVVLIVFMLLTSMAGRKERKRRATLLSSVKRGDRVQTVGGEIGTVVDLSETEMTLRVDEVTNTRIRFARSALQQVLKESKDSGAANKAEPTPAR